MSEIIEELTNIHISVLPFHFAVARFLVVLVMTFIRVSIDRLPNAFAVFEPVHKHAFVDIAIAPVVFSVSVGCVAFIVSLEDITVTKCLNAISVLDKVLELSLVLVIL